MKVIGMSPQPLGDEGGRPALLPAFTDQLADQRTPVLASLRQKLLEAVLGFAVQPDGEGNGIQGRPCRTMDLTLIRSLLDGLCPVCSLLKPCFQAS